MESDDIEDILTLRPSTLTALTSFLDDQAAALEAIASLTAHNNTNNLTGAELDEHASVELQLQDTQIHSHHAQLDEKSQIGTTSFPRLQPQIISVDKFKNVFQENWQLSQFWYNRDTAKRLTQAIMNTCPIDARVAFVCCPTGFVAFKEIALPTQEVLLLEYDKRFSIIADDGFVRYDLDEPLSFPRVEALQSSQDIVVVDPPFHSEMSQKKVASTVAHILCPGGRVILLTGLSMSPLINSIYSHSPLPILRRRRFVVEHDGAGRLETPYGCWVGGGPDDQGGDMFGEILYDE